MPADDIKEAPDLAKSLPFLDPAYLQRYLETPSRAHPGTTMPAILPEQNREALAKSLSAYLLALVKSPPPKFPQGSKEEGRRLYHETGCVACHFPMEGKPGHKATLSHVPRKYTHDGLAAFLHDPLHSRPSGRMPDMRLTKQEASSIATFLGARDGTALKYDGALAKEGKQAFLDLNCVACHKLEGQGFTVAKHSLPLAKLNLAKGCLSQKPSPAPDFNLDSDQVEAIRAALKGQEAKPAPETQIELALTRLNCIACHKRGDYGGVAPAIDKYFHSTEEALGNESRIPPPLTLVGAKLRPDWLDQVLHNGKSIRPYMKTRMPQFGNVALEGLPGLFAQVDKMDAIELPEPGRSENRATRDASHKLLGDQGLNCIACHNYNGKPGPGLKGLDLMTTFQRLQPAWFYNYMKNPAAYRPGILMPSYWPEGKAVRTDILGGDTHAQLRALWYHFSLGRSAGDPSGLKSPPQILEAKEKVQVYRGRSQVAGYRGIAVGFPKGLNYAFNANNGALTALWRGGFVSVGWRGQGPGNFNPAERPIQLAQDVAFLHELPSSWPLRPQTTKENPVDPDPLYPKNHGYQFLGYIVDASGTPTFRYQCGDIQIQDQSLESGGILHRTFEFTSPAKNNLWFRAAAGKIEKEPSATYKVNGLRLHFLQGNPQLRPTQDGQQELIIHIPVPEGQSHFAIHYELPR